MKEARIDLGHARLFISERGSGPPVLFVHALTFDGEMWREQIDAVAREHRAIAVDVRGHGRSEWSAGPVTLAELAEDLRLVLDRLEIERAAIVGLSLGGMLGMRLALAHPARVSSLALLNTTAEEEEAAQREMYHQLNEWSRARKADPETVGLLLQLLLSEDFRRRAPDVVAALAEKLLAHEQREGLYFVGRAVIHRERILDCLGEIRAPALVITSEEDQAVPPARARAIASAIRGAELHVIAGAGHMSAVERPEVVSRLLIEHLDGARADRGRS